MKKSSFIIMLISAVTLFATACNDKNDEKPNNEITQAIVGTYPVTYTVDGGEAVESNVIIAEGYPNLSIYLTILQGIQSEDKIFMTGATIEEMIGGIDFESTIEKVDVIIGGVTYEDAAVTIDGTFSESEGVDAGTGPKLFIEFTATVTPKKTLEEPDPASILITVRDSRLPLPEEPEELEEE